MRLVRCYARLAPKPCKPLQLAVIPTRRSSVREGDHGVEKLCANCSTWWPTDSDFLTRHDGRPTGLASRCRACSTDWQAAAYRRRVMPKPVPLASITWLGTQLLPAGVTTTTKGISA